MVKEGIGRVFKMGRGNTRYVTIPSDVVSDHRFPFEDDEKVRVVIDPDNKRLLIEKIE